MTIALNESGAIPLEVEWKTRTKLQAILNHERVVAEQSFLSSLEEFPPPPSNPPSDWLARHILNGIDLISSQVRHFGYFVIDQVDRAADVSDRYDIARGAIEDFWSFLNRSIPSIMWPEGSRIVGFEEFEAEVRAHLAPVESFVDHLFRQCEDGRQTVIRKQSQPARIKGVPREWGDLAEPPVGPLTPWVNMYQAAAWVYFRTERAMMTLDRASLLHGEIRYSGVREVQTLEDFETALQRGKPVAEGVRADGHLHEAIPAVTWSKFSPVPLYHDKNVPYSHIRIRDYVLFAAFPKVDAYKARTWRDRPPASDASVMAWYNGLSFANQHLAQGKLYKLANKAFPDNRVSHEQVRKLTPNRKPGPNPKF